MKKTCPPMPSLRRARSPSIPRRWACTRLATGCAWSSYPTAAATSISSASARAATIRRRNLKALLGRSRAGSSSIISRASMWRSSRPISGSWPRRSIAPARRRGWCAPTPTATASRIWSGDARPGNLQAAADQRLGRRRNSTMRSANMRRATFATSMRSRRSSTSGWCARAASTLPRPVSISCPHRALLDLAGWPEQDIFAHDG